MTTTSTNRGARPTIRQAGEGDHVWQENACVTVKLAAGDTEEGRVSAAEFLAPAAFGPPLHIHHGEDEILQILEGSIRVVCGETDVVLGPGGLAYLPRHVPHTFRVTDHGPARMLTLFTPGGVEAMFTEAGVPTDAARLPERGTSLHVADLDVRGHQIEMVGPPLDG